MRVRPSRVHRAALIAAALAVALSCSSDPDGPAGSGMDLLGTRPGDVFQDTIAVYTDTVFTYYSMITTGASLTFGRRSGYTRAIIVDFSFKDATKDTNRVVQSADLRLLATDIDGDFPARFYQLRNRYAEADSMPSLDTLAVIRDPGTGSVDRVLKSFPAEHPLPIDLVQGWIRDTTTRTAVVILYTDDVRDAIATFKSRENAADKPQLVVDYTDGTQRRFFARADAVFIRPTAATSNLIISDGYVRRTYFRVRLDELADQSAVHTARVRFHLVPGTLQGTNTTAVIYAPNSPNPASKDFLTGQPVTSVGIFDGDKTVDFKLTNSVFLTLQGSLKDNGFVMRLLNENTELRQIEFYGTAAADSLRPRVFITSSTPATFTR